MCRCDQTHMSQRARSGGHAGGEGGRRDPQRRPSSHGGSAGESSSFFFVGGNSSSSVRGGASVLPPFPLAPPQYGGNMGLSGPEVAVTHTHTHTHAPRCRYRSTIDHLVNGFMALSQTVHKWLLYSIACTYVFQCMCIPFEYITGCVFWVLFSPLSDLSVNVGIDGAR